MGLTGEGRVLSRSVLPISIRTSRQEVRNHLFEDFSIVQEEDPDLLLELQAQIKDYFRGKKIDSWDCDIDYSIYPLFVGRVLQETASIPYGTIATYGELACLSGSPRGARAAGQALKRNRTRS
jgi:O6-methylguanine-DNA--protein-cysteine methyltransferase